MPPRPPTAVTEVDWGSITRDAALHSSPTPPASTILLRCKGREWTIPELSDLWRSTCMALRQQLQAGLQQRTLKLEVAEELQVRMLVSSTKYLCRSPPCGAAML